MIWYQMVFTTLHWCIAGCVLLTKICCYCSFSSLCQVFHFLLTPYPFNKIGTASTLDPPFITPKGQKNIIGRVPLVKVCRIFWQTHPPGTF